MQWIGERFFKIGERWIDAATAREARVLVAPRGRDDQIAWSDECGKLATLRHPLLNPLLDFGTVPGGVYEAYANAGALPLHGSAAEGVLEHASRFLLASGVTADGLRASRLMRPVVAGRTSWRRPIGVTIQARRAQQQLEELLDSAGPVGPALVDVVGPSGIGLRTLYLIAARAARLRGFIPLAPEVLERFPAVMEDIRRRHVCMLDGLSDRRPTATFRAALCELASASTRRHIVLCFRRAERHTARGLRLERMSVRSLAGMVFTEAAEGPGEEALITAARSSDGRPGRFIAELSGQHKQKGGSMMLHETPARYVVTDPQESPPAALAGRVLGSALRAAPRAAALARSGRHAAAARVLGRGVRVLEARQRPGQAAECALQLGWLALDRGRLEEARRQFARGRALAAGGPLAVLCATAEGVALVDSRRPIEAEAVLRGAVAAAHTFDDRRLVVPPVAALGRCLFWQDRWAEGVAITMPHRDDVEADAGARARLLAVLSRCQTRLHRDAGAVATARDAQAAASRGDDPRAVATAELALAEALDAAGDRQGARAALARAVRVARQAHLPLFRVRAALLTARTEEQRNPRILRALQRASLPPLLAERIRAALESQGRAARSLHSVQELESLLTLSQRSPDDRAALGEICRVVAERLRTCSLAVVASDERTLAVEGRGLTGMPSIVRETLACGTRTLPDLHREPPEAAEPIRYGGEVIAALTCRWTAGAAVDREGADVLLRAAALSAAAPVRALLDTAPVPPPSAWSDLLGDSPVAVKLREAATRAARAPFPVLVEGESGSGKELVARAIHRLGPRRDRRFCALNCAALTDDLIEAELFGHTRGAFTGALTERAGLFEEADGGTLFLDEVAELSARAQAKLLRVLQEGEVKRVGENFARRVDVRVVAATNRSLEQEVTAGRFRVDLRFRLDVVRIAVPPLRERRPDIPLLATHFWRDAAGRVGSRATLSPEALAALARYDWPGNVRELQNVIAWAAVHSPLRGRVGPSAFPRHVAEASTPLACTLEAAREEFERRFIRAALAGANGQRTRAADALGVSRQGLAKMMRRLRIE